MTRRQKRALKRKIERLVQRTLYIIGATLIIWFCISWLEVITHNMDDYHDYWDGNIFVLMTQSIAEEQL